MKIVLGFFLIAISLFGSLFFRNYNGVVIANPGLWYAGFIALGALGFWLIYTTIKRKAKAMETSHDDELKKFIAVSEKVELDFDHCEFKSGTFSHQVEDENISSLKWMTPTSASVLSDMSIQENVIQSYLVYTSEAEGNKRFISQYFPFDETTLKFYVLQGNIILHVDRRDRNKYFFHLNKS